MADIDVVNFINSQIHDPRIRQGKEYIDAITQALAGFDQNIQIEGKMFVVDRNWVPGSNKAKIKLNVENNPGKNQYSSTRNVQVTGKVPKDMAAAAFVGGTGVTSGKKGATVKVI